MTPVEDKIWAMIVQTSPTLYFNDAKEINRILLPYLVEFDFIEIIAVIQKRKVT